MTVSEKLQILADSAKYDVACTSSGSSRGGQRGMTGSAEACGICHTFAGDGRCVSLLKVLLTNYCVFDCQYCVNRRSNDVPRAMFTPREVADLTLNFYRRNYIEGLFLSSAVVKNPDYTQELMYETLSIVRREYRFNGYIHVKCIPGANKDLIRATGLLADRLSCNIELPSEQSLNLLAPDKPKTAILAPMAMMTTAIVQSKAEVVKYRSAPKFAPAGQSTQMIVGASPETDSKIVTLAEGLYRKYKLKRVFYSAYIPVPSKNTLLPNNRAPLLREHRLYQADWLLRFYNFTAGELFDNADNLSADYDPKCDWAIRHPEYFPVEINTANWEAILRVPGIGVRGAQRIVAARRASKLDFDSLKKMGIVLKRAKYFITCGGKRDTGLNNSTEALRFTLSENKVGEGYEQLALAMPEPKRGDLIKAITGEM